MSSPQTRVLIFLMLALIVYLLVQSGEVFFAAIFTIVAVLFLFVRILQPSMPKAPPKVPGEQADPWRPKPHPPYPDAQAHISRHTYGFGTAMNNVGRAFYQLLMLFGAGFGQKPKDDKKDKKDDKK